MARIKYSVSESVSTGMQVHSCSARSDTTDTKSGIGATLYFNIALSL